ncbi:MAG: hypothetical protein O3C67_07385 [Cyanobacteria bacterium]|nr:hypothetical protein [Cyanobacteriota bacterium]MEB3268483.1 hypothetical protein [Leptolyngbya sp.]
MAVWHRWLAAATTLGTLSLGWPAWAEAPSVYYAWRTLAGNPEACVEQARLALAGEQLQQIQAAGTSVTGRSLEATAVVMCVEQDVDTTTVMVVVSSLNEEAALTLREALKERF